MVVERTNQKVLALLYLVSEPLPNAANSRDVPTEFAAEHNKDEVLKGKFCDLNFLPSTFFPVTDTRYFFLKFKTSTLSNTHFAKLYKIKLLKQPLFQKRQWSLKKDVISRQEQWWLPKSTMQFPAKKRWHSPPPVRLPWYSPPPPPPAYVDITTKISRIDRLPDFLTHGAPLAHFVSWSSAIIIVTKTLVY